MSDPYLGLLMLGLIVVVIMLGFPTAFTLMGLGMAFGFFAFYDPSDVWTNNKIFALMVQRTYGGMTNDTLLSIPLFVLMGYVMERGALVDKMFHSVQLAFRGMPASLAVATLVICTFWGIASGLVGAVVVLMGVIALKPMLNAGYDVRLASGVITAGGTLGILIPPSVMIIVYAAVAGQSVVKLYAAAMLPGFFLALLYLIYVIGWALIDPKIAPKLPPEQLKVPIPPAIAYLRDHYSNNLLIATVKAAFAPGPLLNAPEGTRVTYGRIIKNLISAMFPMIMTIALIAGTWWYVVIHPKTQFDEAQAVLVLAKPLSALTSQAPAKAQEEVLVEIGADSATSSRSSSSSGGLIALDADPENADSQKADVYTPPSSNFYLYFWITSFLTLLLLINYYRKLKDEQFEILKLLVESVMPLGILTVVVLAVILLGVTTATESAAIGAAGAFLLAWSSGSFTFERMKQAVFLTTKTTSMVCWLFVGSALFSAVFAILGGQQIIETWVLSMNLSPLQFMLLSQALIFVLGWPLEWTEIIVIFVPIFLPMLTHFGIDPILWGTLVFVNLQAAFLSPPVAMSAFYLKGVAPPHVTLNQIFAGMMPYMFIVIICMAIMYVWPGMTLWLPKYLYGGG